MKRVLFLVSWLMISLCMFAQSDSNILGESIFKQEYLTFKKIELVSGLKIKDVAETLLERGLKKGEIYDFAISEMGVYQLQGSVNNYNDCAISLLPIKSNKDILGVIGVSFENQTSFKALFQQYSNLKSALSSKYYIYESIEKFDDDCLNESASDILKLSALRNNECTFNTIFHVENTKESILKGQVILSISHFVVNYKDSYYVSLAYCTPDNILEQINNMDDL